MSGTKTRWRLWDIPQDAIDARPKHCIAHSDKNTVLLMYNQLRESDFDSSRTLLVTDEHGNPVMGS